MKFSASYVFAVAAIAIPLLESHGNAAIYYVDQNHATASDQADGSEGHPWKTLSHAGKTAKAGDTVWVKAGTYRETLEPANDNVTFAAFRDDKVTISPYQPTVIDSKSWMKLPDRQNVYQCPAKTKDMMVFVDGLALQFEQVTGVKLRADPGSGRQFAEPVDRQFFDTDAPRWTTIEEGKLLINLDGENPAEHRVELRHGDTKGMRIASKECQIRGFEIRDATVGVEMGGERNIVEDCLIYGAENGVGIRGWANLVRRCTLIQCWQGIGTGDNPGAHVMEENFIIGTGHPVLTARPPQTDLNTPWGPRCSLHYGNVNFCIFRYNVIAEGIWAGWWPDVNCYSNYFYGNTIWRVTGRGVYNEYPANDSRILYNAITQCSDGITFRFCWRTMTMYNYLADNTNSGLTHWGPHKDNPYRYDNVMAHNLISGGRYFVTFQDDYGLAAGLPKGWPGDGKISASGRYRAQTNLLSDNLYRGKPQESFGNFNGVKFATLEDFQKATGMERGSRVDDKAAMEDLSLGLYTVRVPNSSRPDQAVAVVGNPVRQGVHNDPLPVAGEDAPYFWTQGDAATVRGGPWWGGVFSYTYEWPHFQKSVRRMIRAHETADPSQPVAPGAPPQVWLECEAHPDENVRARIPAMGSGFWSPSLPTVPNAKIRVRFQVSGIDMKPTGAEGGPIAYVRFQSFTNQNVKFVPIFGSGVAGSESGQLEGTFPWRKFQNTATAPEMAGRFSVFLGLRPAAGGSVRYGDIYIETEPGEAPATAKPVTASKYVPIKLNEHFNHDLDADVGAPVGAPAANEFWRDYCDLSTVDLSKVKPGQREADGVPFEISRAVSLRNFRRPPATLPLKVNGIKVDQKVMRLYFVNPGPPKMGAQEYWRYIIHYLDGQEAEVLPLQDPAHLSYRQAYFLPLDTKPQGAEEYGRIADVGTVYRWTNPRPDVGVRSIDFRSMDAGHTVLLAVTAEVR